MAHECAAELVMRCFEARTRAHILHLQTRSFAEHKALNEFYDAIVGLADSFAEAYQGCYGVILTDYPDPDCEDEGALDMLSKLKNWIAKERKNCGAQTQLQNLIDEIVSEIDSTIYKLKFLE